jgi:hypothetical protein
LLNDGAITVEADNGFFTLDAVYDLTGTLSYWNGGGAVPDIDLVLSGSRLYRGISGSDGSYSVSGVPAGTYSLTPNGTSAPETGISAMDASLALRHQAGLQTLTGYALMAADVNRNGSVTAQDASYMLQRAAGLIGLPFQDVGVVWLFDPVQRSYEGLAADQTGQDFTAILLGDPSGNGAGNAVTMGAVATPTADASGTVSAVSAMLALPDLPIPAGQQVVVPLTLRLAEGGIQAADLEIRYDPAVIAVGGVAIGDLPADWLLAVNHQTSPGVIRTSLAGATPVNAPEGQVFLRVTVQAKGSVGAGSDISLYAGGLDEGAVTTAVRPGVLVIGETLRGAALELGGTVESAADYEARSLSDLRHLRVPTRNLSLPLSVGATNLA